MKAVVHSISIFSSIKPLISEEMPKPSPLIEESKDDEVDYIDDSIYSGSST